MMAVNTSYVEPLPLQITAVYESMLPRQPLRCALADDPGAGKTIMAGPYVREFVALDTDAVRRGKSTSAGASESSGGAPSLPTGAVVPKGIEQSRHSRFFGATDLDTLSSRVVE
jgi:hypothetical protein